MKAKITNSKISKLKDNEIFVFGSNLAGNHAGGAAKLAYDKFGAEMKKGINKPLKILITQQQKKNNVVLKIYLITMQKFYLKYLELTDVKNKKS